MKKILITTDYYYPRALANGVCVHQVALELISKGHEVHIVCFNNHKEKKYEVYEGINVHRLTTRPFVNNVDVGTNKLKLIGKLFDKVNYFMTRLNILLFMPVYPISSFLSLFQYFNIVDKLHKKVGFDLVVSVYNPIESILSGMFLKKKYSNIKFVMYTLDTLTNSTGVRFFSKKYIEKKGWKWEQKVYKSADKIFNMKSHENHYSQDRYNHYKEKMGILDIPLINKQDYKKGNADNNINWVYTGGLNSRTRNPSYACKLFTLVNRDNKNYLHFYSRGDCEPMLQNYQLKSDYSIQSHGYIIHEESINIINNANYLISIGNENSDMIPSKIFEYMSTGKPIIHFYKNVNDPCIPYLKEYPLALAIFENEKEIKNNVMILSEFVNNNSQKEVPFDFIKKIFYLNTPQYAAEQLLTVLDDKNQHQNHLNY